MNDEINYSAGSSWAAEWYYTSTTTTPDETSTTTYTSSTIEIEPSTIDGYYYDWEEIFKKRYRLEFIDYEEKGDVDSVVPTATDLEGPGNTAGVYYAAKTEDSLAYPALSVSASSIVLEHESDLVSIRPEAYKAAYCRDTGHCYLGTGLESWILTNVQSSKLEMVDYEEDTTIDNA